MTGSFSDTWGTAYEGVPADNENINLGANRIRDFKVNTRQRIQQDHSFNGDGNDGKHTRLQLVVQTTDPGLDPTDGSVYCKVVGGNTELFYEDSSARVTQLTNVGVIHSEFISGTAIVFMQASSPAGWTQITTVNDQMLRFTNATGGTTGGSWTISGTTVTTNTTTNTTVTTTTTTNTSSPATTNVNTAVSITGVSMSLAMNPVSLVEANLPPHLHALNIVTGLAGMAGGTDIAFSGTIHEWDTGPGNGTGASFTPTGSVSFSSGSANAISTATTNVTSTSTSNSSSPASSASTSTSSFTNDGTWRPAYVNVLACQKN